tara:strand:- start:2657 stop:3544 length:888 start_codon:yes stop_codon:yes gene_type:complete
MWIAVIPRFRGLLANMQADADEVDHVLKRTRGVVGSLNRAYYGGTDEGPDAKIVGSWGKDTTVSPSGDVDVYYLLPVAEHQRFNNYLGNGQSALLASVRDKLLVTYRQTEISGDGQVVIVAFNDLPDIEIAPSFLLADGKYLLPDSNSGGAWITADPDAEKLALDVSDREHNNNARALVRIVKCWRRHCNVPIKSFYLELLVCEFLPTCSWRTFGLYFYDWIVRDFFRFLVTKSNAWVFAPGTHEAMNIGEGWLPRAETALARAEKACEYETADLISLAGVEWQKIFGPAIPESV